MSLNEMEGTHTMFVLLTVTVVSFVTCLDFPPIISGRSFEDVYYFDEASKEPLVFKCSAEGPPAPTYEWFKDGNLVQNSRRITTDEITGELSILGVEPSVFGKYQCRATNPMGVALSAEFEVKRAIIETFSDQAQRILDPVDEYTPVSIPCTGKPPCVPANTCKLKWTRISEKKIEDVKENERIVVDGEGTLHFLYVEFSDRSTAEDPYVCIMVNYKLFVMSRGGSVIMPVSASSPMNRKPELKFVSKHVKGLLHGEAELQCVFSGYPLPEIEWFDKDNNPITRWSVKRNLVIPNLLQSDEGTYSCVGTNRFGRAEANVYLNVTSKPLFIDDSDYLQTQIVPAGKDALFTCNMSSLEGERPPTAPTWRRNGVLLPESQIGSNDVQKYQLSKDKTKLIIRNVQNPEDISNIMCQTGNVIIDVNGDDRYVKTYADASLFVLDPIDVRVLSDNIIEMNEPRTISMVISATIDPSYELDIFIYWLYRRRDLGITVSGDELGTLPWVSLSNDNTNLTIITSKIPVNNDFEKVQAVIGTYTVYISHRFEFVRKEFKVITNMSS